MDASTEQFKILLINGQLELCDKIIQHQSNILYRFQYRVDKIFTDDIHNANLYDRIPHIAYWIQKHRPDNYAVIEKLYDIEPGLKYYTRQDGKLIDVASFKFSYTIMYPFKFSRKPPILYEGILEDCIICYDKKSNVLSRCNHTFCSECIQKYDKEICPYCQQYCLPFLRLITQI